MIEFSGDPKSTDDVRYNGKYNRYHFSIKYGEAIVLCAITVVAIEDIYDVWDNPVKGFVDNIHDILSRVEALLLKVEGPPYENTGEPVVVVKSK